MKPFRGEEEATVVFTVTPDMTANFGGREVHPVLSTWALVHHLEWAARRLLEPHLEAGEEGAGVGVDVRHRAPAPVGARVVARAFCPVAGARSLVCRVEATCGAARIGEGRFFQAVFARKTWLERLARLAEDAREGRL